MGFRTQKQKEATQGDEEVLGEDQNLLAGKFDIQSKAVPPIPFGHHVKKPLIIKQIPNAPSAFLQKCASDSDESYDSGHFTSKRGRASERSEERGRGARSFKHK